MGFCLQLLRAVETRVSPPEHERLLGGGFGVVGQAADKEAQRAIAKPRLMLDIVASAAVNCATNLHSSYRSHHTANPTIHGNDAPAASSATT